uniref:NADH-ubiquinone oxidoreductase chain 2 n=1 Tax=Leptopilina boulardi TaxID=63433 RepID=A0A1L3MYB1_9HYME|nr:NADH2 dehydrogenase subunit 2 [Leptopilina boulardi]
MNLFPFLFMLILSIFMGINSKTMFFMWLWLEVNTMSFIPVMIFFNKYFNDNFIKYFIFQCISSSLMFISFASEYLISLNMLLYIILMFVIFMKMGMFPFLFWYMNIIPHLSYINCLILFTAQKILIYYMFSKMMMTFEMSLFQMNLFYLLIALNSISSVFLIWKKNSIKIILGASSINHSSWLLLLLNWNIYMWMIYFSLYTMTLTYLMLKLMNMNIFNLKNIYKINNNNKIYIFTLMLLLMMMPPTIMFFMKMYTIQIYMNSLSLMLTFLLIMSTVMFYYFYLKILFPTIFLSKTVKNYKNFLHMTYSPQNFFMLLLILFLFNYIPI